MNVTRICIADGCEGTILARGMCRKHYERFRKYGTTTLENPSAEVRLAARICVTDSGCMEWTGTVNAKGYGHIRSGGKNVAVHRLAWVIANGPIPDGLFVCHKCDNPPCCNVEHLFVGTAAQNNADRDAKGRTRFAEHHYNSVKTHCIHGHPFDNENTIIFRGKRICRSCGRRIQTERRRRLNKIT